MTWLIVSTTLYLILSLCFSIVAGRCIHEATR